LAEEGRAPLLRAVDELIRNDDVSRMDPLLHRSDRRRRQDALDAERLHRVDVRAIVDVAGEDAVAASVAREERNRSIAEAADEQGVRGGPERRGDRVLAPIRQPREVVEPAAP